MKTYEGSRQEGFGITIVKRSNEYMKRLTMESDITFNNKWKRICGPYARMM